MTAGHHRQKFASRIGVSCRYLGVPDPTPNDTASDDSQNQSETNHDKRNARDEKATNGTGERMPRLDEEETEAGEKSYQTLDDEMARGEMAISTPLNQKKDLFSGVEFEPALIRAQLRTGQGETDRRLKEAAALYGPSTLRYTSALENDSKDASRVLGQIYREFEARQIQLFSQFHGEHESGATQEEVSEDASIPLNNVLSASTKLLTETQIVWDEARKKKVRFVMPPRFVPHRAVDLAWTTAVAAVCARQIWHLAGRSDGHRPPNLSVEDLMDVVAWVEHLQDTVEQIDEELSFRLRGQKKSLDLVDLNDRSSQPRLFNTGGAKGATEEDASDGLAWVYAALDDVKSVARDELVTRFTTRTLKWATEIYKTEHVVHQMRDGRLFTSLPEYILSPMATQLHTICDRLPLSSDTLPAVITGVLSTLRQVQLEEGSGRLSDFERRCAAANDFERMGEQWENTVSEILRECFPQCKGADHHENVDEMKSCSVLKKKLEAVSWELVHTFSSDSVRTAKSVILPVFDPIRIALESKLFGLEWEDTWTQNELAGTLTATIEDFLGDLRSFLGEYLLMKATGALISASVVFYIECLLKKAGGHGGVKASSFANNDKALLRISGDVEVMREYYDGLLQEMPALKRIIEEEFKVLADIHELMSIAAGISSSEACDFILPLHKRIRDVHNTKRIVKDLWHLISPEDEKTMLKTVSAMKSDLLAIAPEDEARATKEQNKLQVPGMRLDDMVEELYGENDGYVFGDLTRGFISKSGEKLARGCASFSRSKKEPAQATEPTQAEEPTQAKEPTHAEEPARGFKLSYSIFF